MTQPTRLWISCCAVLVTACAGDDRLDPSDLELRDLLGVSPDIASSWDRDQRAAARAVIEAGLHPRHASPGRAALGDEPGIDRRLARALAAIDGDRARHRTGALGAVDVAIAGSDLVATPRTATLAPHAAPPTDVQLRGWDGAPSWNQLPARGMDVLAGLASDAGHPGGPLVVAPAPQLAVVAGYLPATASGPAQLVVNPVALAALEPRDPPAAASAPSPTPALPAAPPHAAAAADPAGNPYSFYGSVAECAAAERDRCEACLASNACTAITPGVDGNAECRQLGLDGGRGYYLICINLALAIDTIAGCAERDAPSCPRDRRASESLSTLDANAGFLDNAACAAPLDACLATQYGPPGGSFPGPGSDPGTSPRPRHTSMDCGDACNGDANCDGQPNCDLDGASCDTSDGGCSDASDSSGCDGGGGPGGGGASDSCSGDSEDACGSSDNSSCDSSDCGGGGDSCDSGGGGDCGGGGGGDCGGGGGDCSGGGDCGGGGDCNIARRRGLAGPSLPVAVAWALLPIPFATWVRRRAARRRAQADDADASGADREVAP